MLNLLILLNVATNYDTTKDDYPKLDWGFFVGPLLLVVLYGVITFYCLKLLWRLGSWGLTWLLKRFS